MLRNHDQDRHSKPILFWNFRHRSLRWTAIVIIGAQEAKMVCRLLALCKHCVRPSSFLYRPIFQGMGHIYKQICIVDCLDSNVKKMKGNKEEWVTIPVNIYQQSFLIQPRDGQRMSFSSVWISKLTLWCIRFCVSTFCFSSTRKFQNDVLPRKNLSLE
jgi:hypothetical protein